MVGWLVDCLDGLSVGRPVGRSVGRLVCRLGGWVVGWLGSWVVGWLGGWFVDWCVSGGREGGGSEWSKGDQRGKVKGFCGTGWERGEGGKVKRVKRVQVLLVALVLVLVQALVLNAALLVLVLGSV